MAPENFDRIIDRRDTASEKWEKYRNTEILPMWVADTDFMSPPAVIEALRQRIDHGVFGYTNTPDELVERVIARLQQLYGWHIEPDWLVWLPGLVCGLNLSCRAVGRDDDSVLVPKPVYPPFMSAPRFSSRQLITVPMQQQGHRWLIDFDALEAAIEPDSRLLLFCNPHNPGGAVYRREELARLAAIAEAHDLVICSDEIHCDLILEPELSHVPLASLGPAIEARTITLMAPSKTYNIAGLGCSFAIIPDPELRRAFRRVRKGIVPGVNLLGYTAALAAYRDGDDWNRRQLEYLRANRDYLVSEINQIPGLHMEPVEATYLAWIDISAAKLENPAHFFEQAGVGLSPGRDFGDDRYMRLNFGCPRGLLEEAVHRIRSAMLNSLPA
ncbi:aspartate aminotransferase [Marinobacterium nitratireducens]|uniref:cysteine-S-conjugate beta-lyase n=1 Tax=Marinobacterium nitratireducens TaxID=518897 RepID=A0A917ZC22_9GAMM|nr:PatB family C-S lyase [Marinobacterium nitratireducens]GGO78730.1 aspartate aminotransferase [Marinobacterium nitratireducens]